MAEQTNNLKIALFCGGAGTRLWPASRQDKPKQFQPLVSKESTFQMMVKRLKKGFAPTDIFPITNRENVSYIVQQAPEIPLENIIIEPERRDSLAAVGMAAAILHKKFANPVVLSLWSDHLIKNNEAFIAAIKAASVVAKENQKTVEIAVRPTFPSTQLGYLQIGKMIKTIDGHGVFDFVKQIEKPGYEDAKRFVQSWEYLWHIGYAVWPSSYILSLFKKMTPAIYVVLSEIEKAYGEANFDKVLAREYQKIPKNSIDYGIFVKLGKGDQLVLTADLGWSDIGAWDVLKDDLSQNSSENVTQGLVFEIDSRDNLLYSQVDNKLLATIGLSGYIVVDTPDALLICPKNRSQDVKRMVEKLKEAKKDKFL